VNPDDPRHGEYRGYLAHRVDDEPPCDRCALAAFRRNKAMRQRLNAGIRHRVPIGVEAYRAIHTVPAKSLGMATGLSSGTIRKIKSRLSGPESVVLLSTRNAILSKYRTATTPTGLARRLQAITAMGWAMSVVAEGTPFSVDAYKRIRRGTSRQFVQSELGECIVAAYDRYSMRPAPDGRSAARTRKWAEAMGWLSALAWDDETIDDPRAHPMHNACRAEDGLDESLIQRRMTGDRTARTRGPESVEVVRRLILAGHSQNWINQHTGLKTERYMPIIRAAREQVAA
jgi:hypothetical protein